MDVRARDADIGEHAVAELFELPRVAPYPDLLGDGADEIVREFKQHFVDTKLFWDQYAHGKFSQYFFKAYEQPVKDPNKETAHQLVEEAQLFVDAAYQCYSKTGNLAAAGAAS